MQLQRRRHKAHHNVLKDKDNKATNANQNDKSFPLRLFLASLLIILITINYYKVPLASTTDTNMNATLLDRNPKLQYRKEKKSLNEPDSIVPECDDETKYLNKNHKTSWKDINNITSQHSKLSGGLFLYPLQQKLLSRIIKAHIKDDYTICETGFGAGHGSSFFLSIDPRIQVVTFDKFDRPYQLPVIKYLQDKFNNRITHVIGDTCDTVPKYLKSNPGCDLLHGSSFCKTDNIDLIIYNSKCSILTSTAMDSLLDRSVYFGPNSQWRKLRNKHCISDIACFQEEPKQLDRAYVFTRGKSKGTFSHQFCFAWDTGICRYNQTRCNQEHSLFDVCREKRIEIPS